MDECKKTGAVTAPVQRVEKVNSTEKVYQFVLHPKAPLCKGGWHANSVTGGLCGKKSRIRIGFRRNGNIILQQSLSHFSLCAKNDSSLYTREPWALPRQRVYLQSEIPVPSGTGIFQYQSYRPVMADRTSTSIICMLFLVARPSSMSMSVKPPSWVQTIRLVLPSISSSTAR